MSAAATAVVRRFQTRLTDAMVNHAALLHAVDGHRRQPSLESLLADQFAFTTTVLWEVFLSDVLMAYVSEDPSTFLVDLNVRLRDSVTAKFGATASKHVKLQPPATISAQRIPEWLDPKDFNISFPSAAKLSTKANSLLPGPAAKRFTLSGEDAHLFDFSVALRNYLAHRSSASRKLLSASVTSLKGANALLNAPIPTVSVYLKTAVTGGDTRAVLIARRLHALAGVLVP